MSGVTVHGEALAETVTRVCSGADIGLFIHSGVRLRAKNVWAQVVVICLVFRLKKKLHFGDKNLSRKKILHISEKTTVVNNRKKSLSPS